MSNWLTLEGRKEVEKMPDTTRKLYLKAKQEGDRMEKWEGEIETLAKILRGSW